MWPDAGRRTPVCVRGMRVLAAAQRQWPLSVGGLETPSLQRTCDLEPEARRIIEGQRRECAGPCLAFLTSNHPRALAFLRPAFSFCLLTTGRVLCSLCSSAAAAAAAAAGGGGGQRRQQQVVQQRLRRQQQRAWLQRSARAGRPRRSRQAPCTKRVACAAGRRGTAVATAGAAAGGGQRRAAAGSGCARTGHPRL